MTTDLVMQRECHDFVVKTLGTDSDNAASYYGCPECKTRWGRYTLTQQETMTFCPICYAGVKPEPVEAVQPAWVDDEYPPGYVFSWLDEPEEGGEPQLTTAQHYRAIDERHAEVAERVNAKAEELQKQDSRKRPYYMYLKTAATQLQPVFAAEGFDRTPTQLREIRNNWFKRARERARYQERKRKRKA